MDTVIVHPNSKEQAVALRAFLKALKLKYEVSTYDPVFVSKIKESKEQIRKGKTVSLTLDEIWPK